MQIQPYKSKEFQTTTETRQKNLRDFKSHIFESSKQTNPEIPLPFKKAVPSESGYNYILYLGMYEIYNEKVFDSFENFTTADPKPKRCYDDGSGGSYIRNQNFFPVTCLAEALTIYKYGRAKCHTASTGCNQNSSRGHTVVNIRLAAVPYDYETKLPDIYKTTGIQSSEISFIDLAGAEKYTKANIQTTAASRENKNIHTSLLSLKRCIKIIQENCQILVDAEKRSSKSSASSTRDLNPVPFRDSKLTNLIKQFFVSARSKVMIIVNIDLSASCIPETEVVLEFASIASSIHFPSHTQQTSPYRAVLEKGPDFNDPPPKKPVLRTRNANLPKTRKKVAVDETESIKEKYELLTEKHTELEERLKRRTKQALKFWELAKNIDTEKKEQYNELWERINYMKEFFHTKHGNEKREIREDAARVLKEAIDNHNEIWIKQYNELKQEGIAELYRRRDRYKAETEQFNVVIQEKDEEINELRQRLMDNAVNESVADMSKSILDESCTKMILDQSEYESSKGTPLITRSQKSEAYANAESMITNMKSTIKSLTAQKLELENTVKIREKENKLLKIENEEFKLNRESLADAKETTNAKIKDMKVSLDQAMDDLETALQESGITAAKNEDLQRQVEKLQNALDAKIQNESAFEEELVSMKQQMQRNKKLLLEI